MTRSRLTRRGFMQLGSAAAAGSALLPFVPILESEAADGEYPTRLILFYQPVGTWLPNWRPSGGENDFQFGSILAPLEPHRQKLLVLDGIDNRAVQLGPGGGGHPGISCLWTGRPHTNGDMESGGASGFGWPAGESIDQFIASQIAQTAPTPFPSIEAGVNLPDDATRAWRTKMSFAGSDEPIPAEDDPSRVFDKLFADAQLDPLELQRRRASQLSVIDTVQEDLARVSAKVSSVDRQKIESHLDNLRTIENRLSSDAQTCDMLPLDPGGGLSKPEEVDAQIELVSSALECGMTRVASLFMGKETAGMGTHTWLGHNESSHSISHRSDNPGRALITEIHTWYAEQFKKLLDRLDSVVEGDGTMLDHSCVVWASSIGNTWTHTPRNVPVVLAGGCCGYFRTGRYLRWGTYEATSGSRNDFGGEPMNKVLTSVCDAMGFPVAGFGDQSVSTGVLDGLT